MNASITSVKSVDDYIAGFVPQLTARLNSELEPLFDPGKDAWHDRLTKLGRAAFRAQGDAVMGLSRTLERQNFGLLVGEMGTGKTLMGSTVPYVLWDRSYRALIMCPGHLVEKWAREIAQTIPDATVRILWKLSDLLPLTKVTTKAKGREYYIIARDRAKLGYRRKAACWLRRRPYKKPPKGYTFDATPHPACPHCGAFIVEKKTQAPVTIEYLEARALFCATCGERALWSCEGILLRRRP